MARIEESAIVLLAAGLSRRFGDRDKLTALLEGKPLTHHAAGMLMSLPFASRIIVTGGSGLEMPGWQVVANPDPASGMSRSLALGVAAAGGAAAVVVALADMPRVTADHVVALFSALDARGIVGTQGPDGAMPPALFAARRFPALMALDGDRGARALLSDAVLVAAPPDTLVDIDTPEMLARLSRPPYS